MTRSVCVVVTTYNRPGILGKNIDALLSQNLDEDVELEIIIVDDYSKEENSLITKEIANRSPLIKYHRNETNSGLSASRNAGALISKSKFILFLDDDIIAEPGYVMGHVNNLSKHANVATVGSLRFPPELTRDNNLMKYLTSRELRQRNFDEKFLSDLSPQYLGGGICGMSKNTFSLVKGFSEEYLFYGGEDVEMGYSLNRNNIRIAYAESAKADHFDSVIIDRYRNKYIESGREGIKLMLKKDPYFFNNSSIRYILPTSPDDSFSDRFCKFAVSIALSSYMEKSLRFIAKLTNRYSLLYSKYLYHLLFACWMFDGIKDKKFIAKSTVEYNG